jgi:DNA topoisomerase-2
MTKTIEEKYQKLSQREHVLLRGGMYISSTTPQTEEMWVMNSDKEMMEKKMVKFTPGFLKIFDEILTNATDHSTRDQTLTTIKVDYNKETGEITVFNNGDGVPVEMHKEHNMYVPELIFGYLLSGSNYSDSDDRTGAGTNGIGSKAVNIYSKSFTVDTIDSKNGLRFVQTFTENMSERTKAKVTKNSGKSYTKITFIPDYKRFGMKGLDDDTRGLIKKRVYDCIACTDKHVSIYLNGEKLKGKGLMDYSKYFFDDNVKRFYESNDHPKYFWEWVVIPSESFEQVSFVNGNSTYIGGKHIDHLVNYQIVSKLKTMIESKKKIKDLKPSYIKDKLCVFLRATVKNPSFSSQTKEQLTTQVKDFGTKIEVSDAFIQKLYKSDIVEEIVALCRMKESRDLSKQTDGKKTTKVYIQNLEDALYAGTSKSNECTLILTEGLSAKTFAIWGRAILDKGIERYGIMSLKGKILNVRDASMSQLMNNEEINNLKQILGLKQGKIYNDTSELRYSKIMILTDADLDGNHIKGLLVNVFHYWWPQLLKLNFIQTLRTPIVVVSKGKVKKEFYTEGDYNIWKQENNSGWTIKYFKGLGTSKKEDAKDIFGRLNNLKIDYDHENKKCDDAIVLAFEKDKNVKTSETNIKLTDQRKIWLQGYDKDSYIDSKTNKVSYQDFINKELIHFSIYDNMRSIPNMIDGLKPSQRKIMHYMLDKCSTTKDIKVAQLSGYVSAETNYHHGEVSLQQAIINLAQDYTGSNNLNFLAPNGNFGSKFASNDAASPRYIFTRLMPYTPVVFNKKDMPLLDHILDDGDKIEPTYFVPIIPTVLLNGISGIGTGYSCSIPPHNPKDIIKNIRRILDDLEPEEMMPYYKGFNGIVEKVEESKYQSRGVYERIGDTMIRVTELPIGVWISNYKEFLESLIESNSNKDKDKKKQTLIIKDAINKTKDETTNIRFDIEFKCKADLDKLIKSKNLEKEFKLIKQFSTNNMYLFDDNSIPVKYNTTNDILLDFYDIRLSFYTKRKAYLLKQLKEELVINNSKMRFITEYMDDIIQINRKSKVEIVNQLEKRDYHKMDGSYDYLIRMSIGSLTKERVEELDSIIKKLTNEYKTLKAKTSKVLWLEDLDELEKMI